MLTLPTTHASLRFNVTYIYVTLPDVIHWYGGDGLTQVKPGRLMLSNNPDRYSYRGMPGQYGHAATTTPAIHVQAGSPWITISPPDPGVDSPTDPTPP